jgi:hypothetical protein
MRLVRPKIPFDKESLQQNSDFTLAGVPLKNLTQTKYLD